MFRKSIGILGFSLAFLFMWGSKPPARLHEDSEPRRVKSTPIQMQKLVAQLKPIQQPLPKPEPGDWLAEHKENGQTLAQYIKQFPAPTPQKLSTLYIQPIGDFGETQQKLVTITAECLEIFYGRPVKTLPGIGLDAIPESARRKRGLFGKQTQILSTYVLNEVLKPKRPADALAVLALSAEDLWPGKGWNFVFGQASLSERVGVWSIQRFGDPDESPEAFQLCLQRTLGTAVHETGHMLGIPHCTAHLCGMNGSNSLDESDRGVLHFCAECQPKVWWSCGLDPQANLKLLIDFATKHHLDNEREYWQQSLEAVSASPTK